MHFLHLIAVEADDAEEAIRTAENAIVGYGDGEVWDWHQPSDFAEVADLLRRLLADGPASLDARSRLVLGWILKDTSDWLLGHYSSESEYYDGVDGGTEMTLVRQRCQENPARQWLVAMDLHN
jgi:hypothetical protein